MPRLDCCVWQLLHHIDFSGLSFASSYHFCQLLVTFLKQHVLNFPHIQKKSESLNCPLITSRLAQVFTKWQVGRRRLEAARAKELGKVFSNKPNQTTTTESSGFFSTGISDYPQLSTLGKNDSSLPLCILGCLMLTVLFLGKLVNS